MADLTASRLKVSGQTITEPTGIQTQITGIENPLSTSVQNIFSWRLT